MSNVLNLVFNPDPRLREVSKELPEAEIIALADLADSMAKTMVANEGIGLAAPQIGRTIRLIVVNTADGPIALANPVIIKESLLSDWGEEGCLSIPKVFGDVKRKKAIRCQFTDITGKSRTIDARGLLARVIQHEIDHLNGILFIDKAKNIHEI